MYSNPCNDNAFKIQAVAIIIGPTIICIGLYLMLNCVAMILNPAISRLPPRYVLAIIIPADMSCLILQAIGGGIAVAAGGGASVHDVDLLWKGNRAIIAGICLQVAVLLVFGVGAADYLIRVRKWISGGQVSAKTMDFWNYKPFTTFLISGMGMYCHPKYLSVSFVHFYLR
jgi:hypothetical protein